MTTLLISPAGEITTLYQEVLDLAALGAMRIERASHVEPDADGKWWAEIIDGPKLGPFALRSEALAAEVAWLVECRIGQKSEGGIAELEMEDPGSTD